MAEQDDTTPKIGPNEQTERLGHTTAQPDTEILERTAGVRQGDPNDARYFGPTGLPESGFGTGDTDYGGSEYGAGSPLQNYQPGYGLVPGYGAMGTQGAQGTDDQPPLVSRDQRIRQDVLQRIAKQPALVSCQLEIEVINSIVTVQGNVPDLELKRLVYATIEPMREVRDIINAVEVKN